MMTDELFPMDLTPDLATVSSLALSRKQRAIFDYLRINSTITLLQATALVGRNVYTNSIEHTGALLSRMVKRGLIVRVKPGLFKRP